MRVFGKILLFGEYAVLRGGNALSVPSPSYSGQLKFGAKDSQNLESHNSLAKFMRYLENKFTHHIDWEEWQKAAQKKVFFESNIPQGYGLGSSAALLSAILHQFGKNIPSGSEDLKALLSEMEGFFHGKSSGLDALVCYLQKAVKIKNGRITIGTSPEQFISEKLELIDSKQVGLTQEMVDTFKAQPESFFQSFDLQYVKATNRAIAALDTSDWNLVFEATKTLSAFVFEKMPWTIPETIKPIWEESLSSNTFCLKLCGSGGGGFALRISK